MGPGHSLTQGSNFLTSCKNVGRNFFLTTFGNYLVSNAWHTHTNTQHLLPSICRIYTYIVHTCQVKSGRASTAAAACQQLVSNCFASLLLSLTVFWWMPIWISKNIWKYFHKNISQRWGEGSAALALLIAPIMCGSFNPLSAFLLQLRSTFSAKSAFFLCKCK